MFKKEVNAASPLRILDASIHGGLGNGNLGVLLARAGVGKTACLVQIGLDDLMRDRKVLHITLGRGHTVEHVQSWYDALFDDLAHHTHLEDREAVRSSVASNRIIQAEATPVLKPERLEQILALFSDSLGFSPDAILVDGFDWEAGAVAVAAALGSLRATAQRLGAEVWMSARAHREDLAAEQGGLPAPLQPYVELVDVALGLFPEDDHVLISLLKDHDNEDPHDTTLQLQCDTMRLVVGGNHKPVTRLPAAAYTMLSGGAPGTEALFGETAEAYGVGECHYSFEGRTVARNRGLVTLSSAELKRGDVSMAYLQAHMHRVYPNTDLFKKVLQSIWYQVNGAGEVFVIGLILPDGTVKGGTGWAAELAKHQHKEAHVFDQEKRAWFRWSGTDWVQEEPPVITATRFTGTGTRFPSDDGKKAIKELFDRSFG